jgi:hypothetical protein
MCILIKNKLFLLVFVVKVEIFFEIVDFEYGFDVDLCVLGLKDDVVGIFFEVEPIFEHESNFILNIFLLF